MTTDNKLMINTLDDIRRFMISVKGGNPDAQQTLNDFMKFNSDIERTNLPTRADVQRMIYSDYAGKIFYPDNPLNPFTKLSQSMAVSFMAKGGLKSEQFVRLMQKGIDLSQLQTLQTQEQERGLFDKLLGRGVSE